MDTKEENKPTLSVVIPAYNVEKYIDRCLKSVLHQGVSPDEYEIIVVDDGSTDSTYKKACRFEGENLKVVRQENKGLSMARNGGGTLQQENICGLLIPTIASQMMP